MTKKITQAHRVKLAEQSISAWCAESAELIADVLHGRRKKTDPRFLHVRRRLEVIKAMKAVLEYSAELTYHPAAEACERRDLLESADLMVLMLVKFLKLAEALVPVPGMFDDDEDEDE